MIVLIKQRFWNFCQTFCWYQIAAGWDENEINECWEYLERECVPMLQEMDLQEDRTTFVLAKIPSLATREEKKMPQAAGENWIFGAR